MADGSETADRLWNVREFYLSILADSASGILSLPQATDKRDKGIDRALARHHGLISERAGFIWTLYVMKEFGYE